MYDIQSKAEKATRDKFESLKAELRADWEAEEVARAQKLDLRLRSHYETVIEHMQSQLDAALKLNDDADKQWMEDVEVQRHSTSRAPLHTNMNAQVASTHIHHICGNRIPTT